LKQTDDMTLQIRALLKARLQKMNMNYASLAKAVGVSLPTIKRWMTKDDFPIEALSKILRTVQLSWLDLVQGIEFISVGREEATEVQETFVINHPRETYIFLQLFLGYRFHQILKNLKISAEELERIMLQLDKYGFIAYQSKKSIRILKRLPFKWSENGPFSKKYFSRAAESIFNGLVATHSGFSSKFRPEAPLINAIELNLTDVSRARLKADLAEILEKYRSISRQEIEFKNIQEITPVSLLLAVDKYPLWKKVLWEER